MIFMWLGSVVSFSKRKLVHLSNCRGPCGDVPSNSVRLTELGAELGVLFDWKDASKESCAAMLSHTAIYK